MTIRSAPYYWLVCDECGAPRMPKTRGWKTRGTHALCTGCGPYCARADCLSPAAHGEDYCADHTESAP